MSNLWDTACQMRAAVMRDGLHLRSTCGVEIGPLANPIVGKGEGDVIYVDHTDAASLRRTYEGSGFADRIVEVDTIWGEQTLLSCLGGQRFDYIMASHVAEHVPDLLTWLNEAGEALLPGGELRLALPDLRYSNDVLRPPTRLSDLLAAWLVQARRPQLRDVLDFRLNETVGVDGAGFYYGRASRGDVRPVRPVGAALDCARMVLAQPEAYYDVHCLAASALQFATMMGQLADARLLRMACARMIDTAPPLYEFYAFLTPSDDQELVSRSWAEARLHCHDPLPGSAEAMAAAQHTATVARTAAQLTEVTERLAAATDVVARLEGTAATQAARIVAQDAAAVRAAVELAAFQGRCAALEAHVSAQQSALTTQAAAMSVRDVEAGRRAAELAEMGARLADTAGHLAEMGRRLAQMDARLATSAHQIAALQNSTSWRITAPLRAVRQVFGPRET